MIKSVLNDSFLRGSFIFFIATFLVGGLNHLYQIVMGRLLGPVEYGVLGSLFALIYLVLSGASTLTSVLSREVSELNAKKEYGKMKYVILRIFKRNALYGAIPLFLAIILSPWIITFVVADSIWSLILVFIIGYLALLQPVVLGSINGLQRFVSQTAVNITGSLSKLVFAVCLVLVGFGVFGAVTGVILGTLLTVAVSFYLLRDVFAYKSVKHSARGAYSFFVPVLLSNVLLMGIITVDILLLQHYFGGEELGFYVALSSLGKIIWFGSGFISQVLFPKVSALSSAKKKSDDILLKGIFLCGLLASVGITAYFVAPNFIVSILYGSEYISIVPHIGYMGLAFGFFSLNATMNQYNLAQKRVSHISILFLGLVALIVGIVLYHSSFADVVKLMVGVNIFMFFLFLLYNARDVLK